MNENTSSTPDITATAAAGGASPVPVVAPAATEEADKKDSNTTSVSITFSTPMHNALQREAAKYGIRNVSEFLRSFVGFAARLPEGVNLNLSIEENGNQPELNLNA